MNKLIWHARNRGIFFEITQFVKMKVGDMEDQKIMYNLCIDEGGIRDKKSFYNFDTIDDAVNFAEKYIDRKDDE